MKRYKSPSQMRRAFTLRKRILSLKLGNRNKVSLENIRRVFLWKENC
jgi:hypothetical protein